MQYEYHNVVPRTFHGGHARPVKSDKTEVTTVAALGIGTEHRVLKA